MKFKINCGFGDSIIIEAETIEEIRTLAKDAATRRGWDEADMWSEPLDSEVSNMFNQTA
jgi:hypothetical protein